MIGVHTPEFAFERLTNNVIRAGGDLRIGYPVAINNDHAIWSGFANRYWPALYLIDGSGRVHYQHFGEGATERTEQAIRNLLQEAGTPALAPMEPQVAANGAEAAADFANVKSPKTYLRYARAAGFASPEGLQKNRRETYDAPPTLVLNQWALRGEWTIAEEYTRLETPSGGIVMRFHARDLHLVLGPGH